MLEGLVVFFARITGIAEEFQKQLDELEQEGEKHLRNTQNLIQALNDYIAQATEKDSNYPNTDDCKELEAMRAEDVVFIKETEQWLVRIRRAKSQLTQVQTATATLTRSGKENVGFMDKVRNLFSTARTFSQDYPEAFENTNEPQLKN